MLQGDTPVYIASCLYGLEQMLEAEVAETLGAKYARSWCEVSFPWAGDPHRLLTLTIAQNLYLEMARFSLEHGISDKLLLREQLERMPIERWVQHWQTLNPEQADQPLYLRVTRKGEHEFTYRTVEEMLHELLSPRISVGFAEERGPRELSVEIKDEQVLIKGRMTAHALAHRPWAVRRFGGMTEPTIARSMVRLADPGTREVFLDPFCGCGTICIERALEGPSGRIIGMDLRDTRLQQAETNCEAAGVKVELRQADAFELPLEDRSVTRLVTHPPQSDPVDGKPWSQARLDTLFAELLRVLDYQGVMALYGIAPRMITRITKRTTIAHVVEKMPVNVAGAKRHIFLLVKEL